MAGTDPVVRPNNSERTQPENLPAEWERPALRRLKAKEAKHAPPSGHVDNLHTGT
jgi:hypothetical protein